MWVLGYFCYVWHQRRTLSEMFLAMRSLLSWEQPGGYSLKSHGKTSNFCQVTCGKSHRRRLHLYHIFLIYSAFPGGSVLISECIGSFASQARGGVTLSVCLQCELQVCSMLLMGPGLPRSLKSGNCLFLKSVSDSCHSVVRGLDLHLSLYQLLLAGQQQISALKHPWWMQRMGGRLGRAPGCLPQRSFLSAWGMWTSSSPARQDPGSSLGPVADLTLERITR